MPGGRRHEDRGGDGIVVTLRQERSRALVWKAEEIGELQIHLFGILRAVQRWPNVRPAAHQMPEKLLTTSLNIRDARIGKRAFRRCELPGYVRDERLPAIELRELRPFRCERRKGPLVFVHGAAELLGLPKGARDGD